MAERGEQIDFSVLGTMEIPEIKSEPKLKEITEKEQNKLKEEIVEFLSEDGIRESESIESFSKVDPLKKKEESQEEEQEIQEEESQSQEDEQLSPVKGIALWAKEQGLVDFDEEKFEDNEEYLKGIFEEKSKKSALEEIENYKNQFPAVLKELAEKYEEGVPLDEMLYSKSREIEYNGIKESQLEEDKELQKKIVSDWLYNQEYTDDEVKKKLQKYEDAVMLEDEAKTALSKLKVFESRYQQQLINQAEENKKLQQEQYNKWLSKVETEIMNAEEIIPGLKPTKEEKRSIFNAYTKRDSKGLTELAKEINKDPMGWYKVTQFVKMGMNFESVKKALTTEATKKVKETVTSYKEAPGSLGKIDISKVRKAIQLSKKQK